MAQENIILNVEVKGGSAEKSVGSIRTQLREANQELIKAQQQFGEYSDEAVKAAKRVAELRENVKDAAETAALFDPGQKFAAFSGALNAVAGGFAAVQGALGLVGVESENIQKQLLKVQSALALSEGLSRITDSAKDFQRLGLIIQQTSIFQKGLAAANLLTSTSLKAVGVTAVTTSTGFKVLRGAIIATGIGALAIGLIALVQNFEAVKKAIVNAIPGLQVVADAIGTLVNKVTDFIGITSEAERQTAKLLTENSKAIRAAEKELEFNGDKYDQYTQRKIKANLEYRKSLEDLLKDEKLTEDERNKYIQQAREKANRDIAKADQDRSAEASKASEERAKKDAEAAKRRNEERKQQEIDANVELLKLQQEATLAAIENETDRALKQSEISEDAEKKRINTLQISTTIKEALITELTKKGERERKQIRDKAAENAIANESVFVTSIRSALEKAGELKKEQQQKDAESLQANLQLELDIRRGYAETIAEQKQVELDAINIEFDARVAKAKQTGEDIYLIEQLRAQKIAQLNEQEKESNRQLQEAKRRELESNLSAYGQIFGQVADLVGKNTAVGKAAAIAEATINTYLSASKAYQAMSAIPPAPVFGVIAAGIATAAGIKNIREIAKVKVPGGGSVSAPSISAPTGATAPIVPQANPQVLGQELNRIAINRVGNAATRAYVVESDVTNSQERIKRLNRAARLG